MQVTSKEFDASSLIFTVAFIGVGLYMLIWFPAEVKRRIEEGEEQPDAAHNLVWIRLTGAILIAGCLFEICWKLFLRDWFMGPHPLGSD